MNTTHTHTTTTHIIDVNCAGRVWVFGPNATRGERFATLGEAEMFVQLVNLGDLINAERLILGCG